MNMKTFSIATLLSATFFCITVQANEEQYVTEIYNFDKAQTDLNYKKTVSYLSGNLVIEITKCDKTIDRLNIDAFKKTFGSMSRNADLLKIDRKITKIEKSKNDVGYLIYSKMTERLVGYGGKFDNTTISTDVTHMRKDGSQYKIDWIKAAIVCN